MTLFATLASLIGTQELALVYIPVLIPVVIALGYDSVTAAAIALVGTTAGFTAGVLNPINTGLAQQIAGIETFSGAGLRALLLVIMIGLAPTGPSATPSAQPGTRSRAWCTGSRRSWRSSVSTAASSPASPGG